MNSGKRINRERLEALYRRVLERLRGRRKPQEPEDPFAYVAATKKPRPSAGSAAAVAELPEE